MSVEFSLLGIAFWKRFCLVDKHFVPFPFALPFREGRNLLRGGFRKPCVISVNTTSCVKPKRGPKAWAKRRRAERRAQARRGNKFLRCGAQAPSFDLRRKRLARVYLSCPGEGRDLALRPTAQEFIPTLFSAPRSSLPHALLCPTLFSGPTALRLPLSALLRPAPCRNPPPQTRTSLPCITKHILAPARRLS